MRVPIPHTHTHTPTTWPENRITPPIQDQEPEPSPNPDPITAFPTLTPETQWSPKMPNPDQYIGAAGKGQEVRSEGGQSLKRGQTQVRQAEV